MKTDPHTVLWAIRFLRKLQAGCGKAAEKWRSIAGDAADSNCVAVKAELYQLHGESHYSHAIGLLEYMLDRSQAEQDQAEGRS